MGGPQEKSLKWGLKRVKQDQTGTAAEVGKLNPNSLPSEKGYSLRQRLLKNVYL